MLDDDYRRMSDTPVAKDFRIPAQRRSSDVIAPLTIGRPRWQRRHAHAKLAINAVTLGLVPVLYLMLRDAVSVPLVLAGLAGAALAITGYGVLHLWLHRLRRHGRAMSQMLAVGADVDVVALVERTRRNPSLGWHVAGACTPTGAGPKGAKTIAGVPVVGDLDSVGPVALAHHFDAVAVGPAPGWTSVRLAHLARDLDRSRTALMVDPRVLGYAGPWTTLRRVLGLPLMQLEQPGLYGVRRLTKDVLDRAVTLVVLLLLTPTLLGCAIAIRVQSGAVLQRDIRYGKGGRAFSFLTFQCTNPKTGLITPVGRIMRRWCLDELPQLFNVLGGSMALVGPRPLLAEEVIGRHAFRRRSLVVKPGLTGLWQMLGDDVLAEQATTVDLRYAERWTPALDIWILIHTARGAWRSAKSS